MHFRKSHCVGPVEAFFDKDLVLLNQMKCVLVNFHGHSGVHLGPVGPVPMSEQISKNGLQRSVHWGVHIYMSSMSIFLHAHLNALKGHWPW